MQRDCMSTVHICLRDIFDVAVACHVIFYPEDTPFFSGAALAVSGAHSILIDADGTGSVTLLPGRYTVRFAKITGNTDTLMILVPNEEGAYELQDLVCAGDWILPFRDFLQKSKNLADVSDPASAFAAIKQSATAAATGAVQLATQAEADAGTDEAKAVTPATLANLAKWSALHPSLKLVSATNTVARLALSTTQVNVGDLVEQLDTHAVYQVLDTAALGHEWGYVEVGVRPAVDFGGGDLRAGLLAEWLFASGSELGDSSGNGNTLSNTNSVSFADGIATFDGSNYLSAASAVGSGGAAMTISVGVKKPDATNGFIVDACTGADQSMSVMIEPYNGGALAHIMNSNGEEWRPAYVEVGDNNWHHVVFRYDGQIADLWVDGVMVSSNSFSGVYPIAEANATTHLGSNGTGNYGLLTGSLKAVRIWNRALTSDEIATLKTEVLP